MKQYEQFRRIGITDRIESPDRGRGSYMKFDGTRITLHSNVQIANINDATSWDSTDSNAWQLPPTNGVVGDVMVMGSDHTAAWSSDSTWYQGVTGAQGDTGASSYSVDEQIIYVGKHGADSNTGLNIAKPKLTFSNAVSTAFSSGYSVVCLDDATYSEKISLRNGVNIYAPNASLYGRFQTLDTDQTATITIKQIYPKVGDSTAGEGSALHLVNATAARYANLTFNIDEIITDTNDFPNYGTTFSNVALTYTNNWHGRICINVKKIKNNRTRAVDGITRPILLNNQTNLSWYINAQYIYGTGYGEGNACFYSDGSLYLYADEINMALGESHYPTVESVFEGSGHVSAFINTLKTYTFTPIDTPVLNWSSNEAFLTINNYYNDYTAASIYKNYNAQTANTVVNISKRNNIDATAIPVSGDNLNKNFRPGSLILYPDTTSIYMNLKSSDTTSIWNLISSGYDGTFLTGDARTAIVQNGIITGIS